MLIYSLKNRLAVTAGGVFAAALVSASAFAGAVSPEMQVFVQMNEGNLWSATPAGTQNPDGTWQYTGEYDLTNWDMELNVNFNEDPIVTSNITFTNNTLATQNFLIDVVLPVLPIGAPSIMGGSIGGSITDSNGDGFASLASLAGGSVFAGLVDGSIVNNTRLLLDPFAVSTNQGGTVNIPASSFGLPGLTVLGPAVNNSVGIRLAFSLTAGDSVAITSFFQIEPIPAPGGLALLAAAGVVGARRRRR